MLKFILLGIGIVTVIFFFDALLPKLKLKYQSYKKEKIRKQNQKAFGKKMKELEIK